MLQNDYFDARIGVDTVEDEPSKVCLYLSLFYPYFVFFSVLICLSEESGKQRKGLTASDTVK